eukprot:364743-Chlamydomonas_euryale.AAC.108
MQGDRRDRLRKILAEADAEQAEAPAQGQIMLQQQKCTKPLNDVPHESMCVKDVHDELFYTEGSEELQAARAQIASFSLRRAAHRIYDAKRRHEDAATASDAAAEVAGALDDASRLVQQCSEVGDDRPISGCRFSPDGQTLAICGWGGVVSLFRSTGCAKLLAAPVHEERCTDVSWHPHAGLGQGSSAVHLATGCADSTAALLSESGANMQLHCLRVG